MNSGTLIIAAALATAGLGAPADAQSAGQVLQGTASGAGGGATAGTIVPGAATDDGAAMGAAGGSADRPLNKNSRTYRDSHGNKYHIEHGKRVYMH